MSDADLVKVELIDGNRGTHPIIGRSTHTKYGYRVHGEQFLVLRSDYEVQSHVFRVVEDLPDKIVEKEKVPPPPTPKPVEQKPVPRALEDVDALTRHIIRQLKERGIHTVPALQEYGEENLLKLKGVGPERLAKIMKEISEEA
jgi:DNA-directed RNA polymerase alpha subunit